MQKAKAAFVCAECGAQTLKWAGQCPDCFAWNTLEKSLATVRASEVDHGVEPVSLARLPPEHTDRLTTGFGEFDRVLGGGLVPGAVILLGGDPGVGKSTLLQQVSAALPEELTVLYASGEESPRQVVQRSARLGVEQSELKLLADASLENVLEQARRLSAQVLVIDSIQTMYSAESTSAPGSIRQLRDCVGHIVRFAKQNDVAVFVIGHVTKEGTIAGPRVVEHMVDTVLYFENDPASRFTMIRAVKNRFGAIGEIGVFAMTETGFRQVKNPSAIFLSRETVVEPGNIVSVAWEGSRALLVEVQALVAAGSASYPKRLAAGIDQARLNLLLAILQRHGQVELGTDDVFVNMVGGMRVADTSADLPVILSIISSWKDQRARQQLVSFGEVGLAGEVRPVRFGAERIAAAAKQGFTHAIVPEGNLPRASSGSIEVIGVRRLVEATELAF